MTKAHKSKSGRVLIEVADDAMSAWMTIQQTGKLIDEQEILDLIDEIGIKYGIEEALKKMSQDGTDKEFNTPFPIAICKRGAARQAMNYYFESEFSDPDELPLEQLQKLTFFGKDSVLADFSYNLFDGEGSVYNIFGEMLIDGSLDMDSLLHINGYGVRFDEDKSRYVSTIAGYPYLSKEGKICILDVIKINHDLSDCCLRTPARLEFGGNLTDCNITAGSSVSVSGDVINSSVYCEGDLDVEGEIRDCSKSFVHVLGNIYASSIIDSKLVTRSSVKFQEMIRNSIVFAQTGIKGLNGHCVLHSGSIQATGSISAGFLGNQESLPLEIEITISAYYKNLLMIKTKELIKLKQAQEIDPEAIELLSEEVKKLETDLDNDMSRFLQEVRADKLEIKADQVAYPDTLIRILKHSYQIKSIQSNPIFVEKD